MKIGVDLDNTIICYDDVFLTAARDLELIPFDLVADKNEIRARIRDLPNGVRIWMALQGKVYGSLISKARLYSGVLRVLWRCQVRGYQVVVVSHKTKFGHFDENAIPLREAAIEFLMTNGLHQKEPLVPIENVSFFATREAKLAYINSQNFDWFIDDLPEILDSPAIPKETRKLGFCPTGSQAFRVADVATSWAEIETIVLGAWTQSELRQIVSTIFSEEPKEVSWIGGRANSQVAKVAFRGDRQAA